MIRTIQELFKITATLVIGSLILVNCEPDPDQLGSQFFQDGAKGTEVSYPIIAYNSNNNDSIRTDAARLQSATLGAFTESQFGSQKSSYVSQVRLSGASPDFGLNAKLDSAVLVIKPQYAADSVTTVTNEDYIYPVGAVPAKRVVSTYPVIKYGNTKIAGKTLLNFKVQEVTDFLGSNTDVVYSNKIVNTGAQIGSKTFDGNVHLVRVTKDGDDTVLFERTPALRIPLDSTFFANKIINKVGSPELSDAASFIRYFKGIRVSVDGNDGYIFNFDPTTVELNLYYKNDKDTNGIITREQSVYMMNMGASNAFFNQIAFNRTGTPSATALATTNEITGDAKLFAQGMGGPGFGLRVPAVDVANIKTLYNNNKIGIVSAKIRIYTDVTSWSNNYAKPNYFVVRQRNLTPEPGKSQYLNDYLVDMSALYGTGVYNLVKAYDLQKNPAYYDIGITQTFKNIIEKESPNYDLILNVGSYTTDTGGNLLGSLYPTLGAQNFNTRSYTANRAVFVGTDLTNLANDKSARLILTYGQKQ
ncbi:DUF4270 domain-containing protein [Kaistella flava (ex Peng et al. 2021)]|uniref:DUF4270 domain-containing protein n=1 Tax=Kaistella flava (ex Peng et al. 2021) TaxID=2038776 RepID=A0A7M2YBR8_9FLAO|nr:DUF4270 family protein [Kaistella flava (ex Peng et al. 2021)]QOW11698.1 DUF4270 domain-containing protein [Kaistella flava (ex Peng et al. 2021)]